MQDLSELFEYLRVNRLINYSLILINDKWHFKHSMFQCMQVLAPIYPFIKSKYDLRPNAAISPQGWQKRKISGILIPLNVQKKCI